MTFAAPGYLWLLPLALLPGLFALRSRAPIGPLRRALAAALAMLALGAAVLALARPWWHATLPTTRIAIVATGALPAEVAAWRDATPHAEPFHVLRAGRRPEIGARGAIGLPPGEGPTDLAAALAAADALGGDAAAIALFTDGSHAGADLAPLVPRLTGGDRVLHLRAVGAPPPLRAGVRHPASVQRGEPLAVRLGVGSAIAGAARLEVRAGDDLLAASDLTLPAGASRHPLAVPLPARDGIVRLDFRLRAAGDLGASAASAVWITPPLRVARLGSHDGAALRQTLAPAQIEVDDVAPDDLAARLDGADVVLLDDAGAELLGPEALAALAGAVQQRGTGLLVAGSPASLTSYVGTPLAGLLPVELEPREERRDPSVALVVILDTSGSMGGTRIELAKEVARLAIRRLLPHDKVGIVEFYGSKRWAAPLQPASNLIEITRALNRLQAGGGTIIFSAIEEAYYALLNARTRFKHILVLTDAGVENAPFEPLARRIADAGIQLNTVLIGPQANSPFLVNLAQWGRGRFYACPSRFQLPELRFKEPQSAPLSSLLEAPPPVERTGLHEVTEPLGDRRLPAPRGIVAGRLRAGATLWLRSGESPFLAGWDAGLGRVATLCCDLLGPLADELRTDPAHGAVLASTLRHLARARAAQRPQLQLEAAPATLRIRVDHLPPPAWPAPRVVRLGDEAVAIELAPAGPGCAETVVDLAPGLPLAVEVELPDGTRLAGAALAPTAPAPQDVLPLLAELALATGGTVHGPLPDAPLVGRGAQEGSRLLLLAALAAFGLGLLLRRWPPRAAGGLALLLLAGLGTPALPAQQPDVEQRIRRHLARHGDLDALERELAQAPRDDRIALARAGGRLEAALALTQDQSDLQALRAELLEALGHPDEAIEAWGHWLARDGLPDAERARALLRRAQLRLDQNQRDGAVADLRAAAALGDDETRHALGHLAGTLGLHDLGLELHRIDAAPAGRGFTVALRRAAWHEQLGAIDAGRRALEQAIGHARTGRDRRYALAELVALMRRQDRLPALADAWLASLPQTPEGLDALLDLLRELGRADEALALLARTDGARPELAFAIALEDGKGEQALATGLAQLARTPGDTRLRSALALLASDLQRRSRADALLRDGITPQASRRDVEHLVRTALDLGLDDPVAAGLARLRASGDPADAIEALALEVGAATRRGKRDDALAVLRAAREQFSQALHKVRLAELFESLGEPADAIAEYRAALSRNDAEDIALRLGWMLAQSKEAAARTEALALFRRVWLGAGSAARRAQVEEQVLDLAARDGTLADLALELEAALANPDAEQVEAKRDALIKIYTRARDSLGAVQILRDLAQVPGREVEAWERIARVHLQNEEFRAHERALRHLLQIDPEHEIDWRQQLAMSALERGRPAEARAVVEELLARDDAGEIAFEFAGGIYALAARHADAARVYRRTLALHPDRIETLLLLGNSLDRAGRRDEALGIFLDQLLRPVPDDLLLVAADGLLNLNAPPAALRCAERAVRRRLAATPDRVHLLRMLQDLLEAIGDRGRRAGLLAEVVRVAGEQRAAFVREQIDEARNEKRWRDYVAHGRTLLALGDEMPPAVFVDLGEALVQVGDLRGAERAFERARLAADFAAIERRVAEVYEKAGRTQDAARIWTRILRRDAGDPQALLASARLEERLGHRDRALPLYRDATLRLLDQLVQSVPAGRARDPLLRLRVQAGARGGDEQAQEALDGCLRCAEGGADLAPLFGALRPRLAAAEPARARALLDLFAHLVLAGGDPALAGELAGIEERLLAAGPPAELALSIADRRLLAGDLAGAAGALPPGESGAALRFTLALLQRDAAGARAAAEQMPPNSWPARIRDLLLCGFDAEARALGEALRTLAASAPDAHLAAWAEAARLLRIEIDLAPLREQRLARALREAGPRRLQAVLAALRADDALPAERHAQVLRELLPEVRASGAADQAWAFVSHARRHLPGTEIADLIETSLTGLQNPTLVFTRLDVLPLLPVERQRAVVEAIVSAAEPAERDGLRLRILTSVRDLDASAIGPLVQPLDLRGGGLAERAMFRNVCLDAELAPAVVPLLQRKLTETGEPVLPSLFVARHATGEARATALRRATREYIARTELDPSDALILERLSAWLPPDAVDWPELQDARTAPGRALRLRLHERAGRLDAALAEARARFDAQPDQRPVLDDLLRLLGRRGDVDGQIAALTRHFDHVATIYPYQVTELAELLLARGRAGEALAALARAEDAYGYGLPARLRAIVLLDDAARQRELARAWVQDRQALGRARRGVFVSVAGARRGGEGPALADVLARPAPPRVMQRRQDWTQGQDPIELLAFLPDGERLAELCLRPLPPGDREQSALYRALAGAALQAGTLEARLAAAYERLATRPFDAEALRLALAAAELEQPVGPDVIERAILRRILTGPTDRLFEAEALWICERRGMTELAGRLLARLTDSRALLSDARLQPWLPALLDRIAATGPERLLALLPGTANANVNFDSELLAAVLHCPALQPRLDDVAAQSAGIAEYVGSAQVRAWRDRIALPWFGLALARGRLDDARAAFRALRVRNSLAIPPHLLGAAIPPLAAWRDATQWPQIADLLLEQAGDPELHDRPVELALILAVRLRDAGRIADARALLARIPRGDARLERWREAALAAPRAVRIATFNAALFRDQPGALAGSLAGGADPQAARIAEIVQRVRPDVLLLQEFDHEEAQTALRIFQSEYLGRAQHGAEPIDYPFVFTAPVNTGLPTGFDLDRDGSAAGPGDAAGFGRFPGQYGMVLLSRHPLLLDRARTFRELRWQAMPDSQLPADWYGAAAPHLPLSSKSHWDVPVRIGAATLHLLCSHPTPPVFDGDEDRNGRRNADEIRFWADYLGGADWIRDDRGASGGLEPQARFVLLGDLNCDPVDGDSRAHPVRLLLEHPRVQPLAPASDGGTRAAAEQGGANAQHRGDAALDTADFDDQRTGNLRLDYVLPARGLTVAGSGVFWPLPDDPLHARLIGADGRASSDHRLVWVDLLLE